MLAVWAHTSSQLHGQSVADVTISHHARTAKPSERFDILVKDPDASRNVTVVSTAAVISPYAAEPLTPREEGVQVERPSRTKAKIAFLPPEKKSCR
jgi:hypothetical protein